jgi:diacylglycerol kinase (ATP)
MANQSAKGWKRIRNAMFFSVAGFKATWQHEEAFRQEVILLVVACPIADGNLASFGQFDFSAVS